MLTLATYFALLIYKNMHSKKGRFYEQNKISGPALESQVLYSA